MESTHETVTQLGRERGEVQAPTREQLTDVFQGVDIVEHKKPSVFIQSCKEVCRLSYDHSSEVATMVVLTCMVRSLSYETNDSRGTQGTLAHARLLRVNL